MSQEKVDYKKAQKKNIKKTVRKRKVSHVIGTIVFAVVVCGMIGWLGFSGYQTISKAKSNDASAEKSIPIDMDALNEYMKEIAPEEDAVESAEDVSEGSEESDVTEVENADETAEENEVETAEDLSSDEE